MFLNKECEVAPTTPQISHPKGGAVMKTKAIKKDGEKKSSKKSITYELIKILDKVEKAKAPITLTIKVKVN